MKSMLKYPLLLMLLTANLLFAQPAIQPSTIESTVLLEFVIGEITNSGSGIFFKNSDNKIYLITACHVFSNPTNTEFKLYGPKLEISAYADIYKSDGSKVEIDLGNLYTNGFLKYDIEKDVAIVQYGYLSNNVITTLPQAHCKDLKIDIHSNSKLTLADNQLLGTFSNLSLGSDVYFIGYPKSLGIKTMPQYNFNVPLLRKGIIAGINKEKKTFIIDAPGYGGNSGGPVFQVTNSTTIINIGGRLELHNNSTTKLIGIVSQRIPYVEAFGNISTVTNIITFSNKMTLTNMFTVTNTFAYLNNSGYAVAVPVEYAVELIKQIK